MADDPFARETVPAAEVEWMIGRLRAHPEYSDRQHMADAYRALGLSVVPDAFDRHVLDRLTAALGDGRPFSAVRFGDSESLMLSYGAYPEAPRLDRHVVAASILRHPDCFEPGETWMTALRDLMRRALERADVVGVLGMWRPEESAALGVEARVEKFLRDYRGGAGQWRGRDHLLRLAAEGCLQGRTVASAHLYLGVVGRVGELLAAADRVVCITNKPDALRALQAGFPRCRFEHVAVGRARASGAARCAEPRFLAEVGRALPGDLRGCLGLVAAGPWSEIYCTWIKDRGGVAVDVGSGLDLLVGRHTRPVHRMLGAAVTDRLVLR